MNIRASKIPLLLACPASHASGVKIDTDSQAARLGTAVHAGIAGYVRDGSIWPATDLAVMHGLDEHGTSDIGWLYAAARRAWDELADRFPRPEVEVEMEMDCGFAVVTGHADLVSFTEDDAEIRIIDWKTGRKQSDFLPQLKTYAMLSSDDIKWEQKPKSLACTVVWLRDGVTETVRFGEEEMDRHLAEIGEAVAQVSAESYRTGSHCEYCPRRADCPARTAMVRSSIRDITGIDAGSILALGDRLPEIYAGVKCAESACAAFRDALREAVAGGPITAGGKTYELSETTRRELDPALAWPVLAEELTDSEIAPAVKISLPKVLDAAAAKVAKNKGKAKAELTAKLDAAGAIKITAEKRMTERESRISIGAV